MVKISQKTKKTSFQFSAPQANSVSVVGNFNDWNPTKHLMKKNKNGTWKSEVKLPEGVYEFCYLVDDGRWVTDPELPTRPNDFGTRNSVLRVDFSTARE